MKLKNPTYNPTISTIEVQRAGTVHHYNYNNDGVTLRDEFAKQALSLMGNMERDNIAKECYKIADEMLEERLKEREDMK